MEDFCAYIGWVYFLHALPNKENTKMIFKPNTKYAIRDEDKDYYYVAAEPNNIYCNNVCRFSKSEKDKLFKASLWI